MGNDLLESMLCSAVSTFDMAKEIDQGKIVLIDTSKAVLGDSCGMYGKFFIFLLLRALYARIKIPKEERYDTFLIIDEAYYYFNQEMSEMLDMVRKLRCGCTFAFQRFEQADPKVRSALEGSTSIKALNGVTHSEASMIAKNMGSTTTDFIQAQPKLRFATWVRNYTPKAVSLPVTLNILEHQEHVSLTALLEPPMIALMEPLFHAVLCLRTG